MASQIVCSYSVIASGGLDTTTVHDTLQNQTLAGVGTPRDQQFLNFWGLRASFDAVISAPPRFTRNITLQMDASVVATATVARGGGASSSPLTAITITGQGMDYILPPFPVVSDPTGQGAIVSDLGLQVLATAQDVLGGNSYNAATVTAVPQGGLMPGGIAATFSVTVVMGTITAVTCTNTGTNGPYAYPPVIVISDPSNPGGTAKWHVRMGVFPAATVLAGGTVGYTNPTVVLAPAFKQMCPDSSPTAQANAVKGWMTAILRKALVSPISEAVPVVS